MPKIQKKLIRGSFIMDDSISNGKQDQENTGIKINEDAASEWIKQCEDISSIDIPEGMFVNRKSVGDKKAKAGPYESSIKKWQNLFSDTMKKQGEKRKHSSETMLRSLSTLLTKMEADGEVLQENDKRLQQLCTAQIKMSQQSIQAHHQKLKALKQIHTEYIKECDETESAHQQENKRLEKELANNMQALQEKLQQEYRRKNVESFRKAMSMMMDA